MATILTHGSIDVTTEYVRSLLDSPSNEYLQDELVTNIVERVYRWLRDNTEFGDYKESSVVDAVYAVAVWQIYGVYTESISEFLKDMSPKMIKDKVDGFRELAIMYARNIGIVWPLDKNGMPITNDIEKIKINYGFSGVYGALTMNEVYGD